MTASEPTIPHADKAEAPTNEIIALVFWSVVACLITIINRFAGYVIHLPASGSLLAHLLSLLYLASLLLALLQTARSAARLPVSTPLLLISGVLLALPMAAVLVLQQIHIDPTFFLSLTANNLFLPVAAALVGAGIGRIIKHPNTLLAASGFALFFDIVVVTMGTVSQLMKTGNSAIISAVSVGAGASVTQGQTLTHAHLPDPLSSVTIGPADVLFLAVFLSAVYQMGLSRRATFAWMFTLLFAALVIVELFYLPIPALAPMGIAVLIANLRHGAFTRQEKRDLLIGAGFAVFCAALIIFGSRILIKPRPAPVARDFRIEPISPVGPIIVGNVEKGSLAEKAGVRPGDAVYGFNGKNPMTMTFADIDDAWDNARKNGIQLKVKHMNKGPLVEIPLHYENAPVQSRQ